METQLQDHKRLSENARIVILVALIVPQIVNKIAHLATSQPNSCLMVPAYHVVIINTMKILVVKSAVKIA